jgi:ABC-type transport system involved in cytochrome bd biosynthesis fused ATPase/permease subunit
MGKVGPLLAAIKSLPGSSPIPVVLCSTLDERKRGMEMGAAAYLVKPVLADHAAENAAPGHAQELTHQVFRFFTMMKGSRPMSQAPVNDSSPILEIKNLKTYFFLEKSTVRALDGINLTLNRKTTLGLVGESGCGKSIMAMSVMRLIQSPPGRSLPGRLICIANTARKWLTWSNLSSMAQKCAISAGAKLPWFFKNQ